MDLKAASRGKSRVTTDARSEVVCEDRRGANPNDGEAGSCCLPARALFMRVDIIAVVRRGVGAGARGGALDARRPATPSGGAANGWALARRMALWLAALLYGPFCASAIWFGAQGFEPVGVEMLTIPAMLVAMVLIAFGLSAQPDVALVTSGVMVAMTLAALPVAHQQGRAKVQAYCEQLLREGSGVLPAALDGLSKADRSRLSCHVVDLEMFNAWGVSLELHDQAVAQLEISRTGPISPFRIRHVDARPPSLRRPGD